MTLVEAIELGDVVYLNIILDAISDTEYLLISKKKKKTRKNVFLTFDCQQVCIRCTLP